MSNVIHFRPGRTGQAESLLLQESAEILFFTGVRYVRLLDAEEAADAAMEMTAVLADDERDTPAEVERLLA